MVHSISKKAFQKFLDSVPWSKVFKKAAQADSHQILAQGTVNKDSQEEDVKNDLIKSFQEMKK